MAPSGVPEKTPRAATPMWDSECLVQIDVDRVEAHVAGFDAADNRVQVRAVVVEQPAGPMDDALNLDNVTLEYAQRRRVGQHQPGGLRTDCGSQCRDVNIAIGIGGDFAHAITAHHR